MIQCGCEFCNDIKNIKPAKYIDDVDVLCRKWIDEAKDKKKFILYFSVIMPYVIINRCPKCGHIFTVEDYDNYDVID